MAIQKNVVMVGVRAIINFSITPELSVTGCSLLKLVIWLLGSLHAVIYISLASFFENICQSAVIHILSILARIYHPESCGRTT